MRTFPLIAVFAAVPTVALALTIAPADYYSDVRSGSPEAAGINMLTSEGIVQGYGARHFGPTRTINRAEFAKIAVEIAPPGNVHEASMLPGDGSVSIGTAWCFPDAKAGDWFLPFVCALKENGIVVGKTFPRRYSGQAYFDPAATVTYGEALKILTKIFRYDIPNINAPHWAEPYYRAAAEHKVDLPMTIDLDRPLTRALTARLAAAFVAESQGLLLEFRLAESGIYSSVSSSSSSRSSSSSSSSSMSSSASSVSNQPLDPISDTTVRSQFLLLGETGPVLGAGKIFLEAEQLNATSITINLTTEVGTVRSLLVYDDTRHLLGRANLDPSASTNRSYKLDLPVGRFNVAKGQERTVYVRPELSSRDAGGQSSQTVQVANIVVKGTGEWSNSQYTSQATTGADAYPVFVTARSTITSVSNAGVANAGLVTGSDREFGRFTIAGRKTDSTALINVTNLTFTVQQTGGVSVTSPTLAADGITEKFPCVAGSTTITCLNIPEAYGSATDAPRILRVYGTITAADPAHASLQLVLNEGGDPTHPGAITWTDGTTTFSWVPVSGAIANGTYYKY